MVENLENPLFFVMNRFLISIEDETSFLWFNLMFIDCDSVIYDQISRHRKKQIPGLKDYEKQFTNLKRVKKQRADWEKMEQKSELPK